MRRLIVTAAATVLMLTPGAAVAQPHHHGGHKECHPTSEQAREAAEFAEATIAATKKYEDPSAALEDDYFAWVDWYKPIHHYVNYGNYYDWRILDPKQPEALVYAHTHTGPTLIGVMYSMEDPDRTAPPFGGCITRWHRHPQCRSPIGYSHIWEEDWGDCPPGWADDGGSELMLHVWTVDMKDGPYAFEPDARWECWPRPAPC